MTAFSKYKLANISYNNRLPRLNGQCPRKCSG